MNSSRIAWLAGPAWISLPLLVGCGGGLTTDYSRLDLAEVRGTVTLDGQPLAGAVVIFEAADRTFSYGRTDSAGDYHLMFNSEKSGVLPGAKIVRIRTSGGLGEAEPSSPESEANRSPRPKERVPACYNDRSTLRVMVAEQSQTINFDLRSDGSAKS